MIFRSRPASCWMRRWRPGACRARPRGRGQKLGMRDGSRPGRDSCRGPGQPGPRPARRWSGWPGGEAPRRRGPSRESPASGAPWSAFVAWARTTSRRAWRDPRRRGREGGRVFSRLENAWATTSGTLAGSRPFSLRLYLTAMAREHLLDDRHEGLDDALSLGGHRARNRRPQGLRDPGSSPASVCRSGRSRLLYWRTRGTFSGTRRLARRLTFMFSKAARFSFRSNCASRPRRRPRRLRPAPHGAWRCTGPARAPCRAGP